MYLVLEQNDGSITVDLSGGDNPITYDIGGGPQSSGAFTGLGGGNYTVTIIDNSACTQTVNITVNEPAAITDSYSVTDEMTGGDGAIDLTISGGRLHLLIAGQDRTVSLLQLKILQD